MNVLIIEDEMKAARELKSLAENLHEDVKVCQILQSVEEAMDWFGNNEMPELILSDIQLADGVSFDIFRNLAVQAPVIFCTAHDEYALRAFETNGIDYLLKPIEKSKLQKSFEKLRQFKYFFNHESADYSARFNNMLGDFEEKSYKSSVLVYVRNQIIPVATEDIQFIHTDNNLVYLYTATQKFEIRKILDYLEAELNPGDFFRANRQFIISRKAVVNIQQIEARKLEVSLSVPTPQPLIVSKDKATRFLKWLKKK
ncbi:Sensory transduction protein LytR [Dyadobacter sp. CECT 9275]|uniref:Sensory transduction protein LytR n=1 Tax=Dyadobacter helix TaxID=2822344 RepID=A0A916JEN5_9BACT|nr:LytTR family DNA-binding domain-containing protein [Dyadobacter sp. CECT 9275]CAG5007730.1 Sensory transduction protein LytR [Dyadobacter sp. CECT 9275]